MDTKSLSMLDSLRAIRPIDAAMPGIATPRETQAPKGAPSFGDFLEQSIQDTNQLSLQADQMMERAVAGEDENPQATMVALQKADISFKLLLTVKEKLLNAYQTVMRTPIG